MGDRNESGSQSVKAFSLMSMDESKTADDIATMLNDRYRSETLRRTFLPALLVKFCVSLLTVHYSQNVCCCITRSIRTFHWLN